MDLGTWVGVDWGAGWVWLVLGWFEMAESEVLVLKNTRPPKERRVRPEIDLGG
ncbi:MAG: hypothetical protein UT14_C0033G0012 [Candidatus Shapirobacteria bacterium GW2011_GWE1_38_92]|uniref:Uncharacterized protein n=1 Tax=Candidatus Shapirobacteria bacterium GW2011_GWE1_38_92 TaxID=1618489 RepID=A0A0G0LHW4_9BACT|nr:MAG: hypothetical protein UT14_C0033G0012 [Candidatus Shapirobacteria bacterium GW2011_GWE1_38_92]